jgi:hypothetical protein
MKDTEYERQNTVLRAENAALRDAGRSGVIWSAKLVAMTNWLDTNEPSVWFRGLWDAMYEASHPLFKGEGAISELQSINAVDAMCVESLDPETSEAWRKVVSVLRETRTLLKEEGK